MGFTAKSAKIEGMYSPENSHIQTSNSPQTSQKSVDYGKVAVRIKEVKEQENQSNIQEEVNEELEDLGLSRAS